MEFLLSSSANQNVGTTVKPCSHRPDEDKEQLTDSQGFKILRIQHNKKKGVLHFLMTLTYPWYSKYWYLGNQSSTKQNMKNLQFKKRFKFFKAVWTIK